MKRSVRSIHFWIFVLFIICTIAFLFSRLWLNSYNMELSQANQALSREIQAAQSQISRLETEINLLQEKTSILEFLDDQLSDNYNNIYIIEEPETAEESE